MKRLVAMVLAGMMALSPIAAFAEEEKNVVNIDGYEFTVPDSWESIDNKNSDFAACIFDGHGFASIYIFAKTIENTDVTSDLIRSEAMKNVLYNLAQDAFEDVDAKEPEDYSAGVLVGSKVDFSHTDSDGVAYMDEYILVHGTVGNDYLYITYSAIKNSPPEFYDSFDAFMKSATIPATEDMTASEPPFDDLHISFQDSMHNDVTGTWRLARVLSSHPITDYIQYYYENYMVPHEGVHVVVDFGLKTTAILNYIDTMHLIDISIYEYVEGDELDAKACPQGMRLGWYQVNTDTWEVTEL